MVFELLLTLLPDNPAAAAEIVRRNNLGHALHAQHRFSEAVVELERGCTAAVSRLSRTSPLRRYTCGNLAASLGASGEWARAWQIYQDVLVPESSPNQLLNAALAARLAGDTQQALKLYQRVQAFPALSPHQQATFCENFAQLLWDAGEQRQAQHFWRKTEALLPALPAIRPTVAITRASVAIQQRKPKLARHWLAGLTSLPAHLETRRTLLLAWADFQQGKVAAAEASLQGLPALTGAARAEAISLQTRIYLHRKQKEAALAYLTSVLPPLAASVAPASPLLRQPFELWAQLLRQAEDFAAANQLEQQLAQSTWQGALAVATLQSSGGAASRR